MFNFRKLAVFIVTSFLTVPAIFAQNGEITKDSSGAYVYETTISSLVAQRVFEEIKLINNSSLALPHVTCTITINGKNHDMRPMPVLKLGDSEGFDGFFEDDMNREFPRYFGKDGKFTKKNNNTVRFAFNFRGHNDDVEITDVYFGEEDLCFVVTDATYSSSEENDYPAVEPTPEQEPERVKPTIPTPRPVPVKQEIKKVAPNPKAAKKVQKQPASNSQDTTVVIDGKTYILHDGKAYQIQ